jgi:transcriptional regulator with XRE-family HTH domain
VVSQIRYFEYLLRTKGWTQNELSTRSNVPPDIISGIKTGRINGTPEELQRIAAALDCAPEQLLLPVEYTPPDITHASGART